MFRLLVLAPFLPVVAACASSSVPATADTTTPPASPIEQDPTRDEAGEGPAQGVSAANPPVIPSDWVEVGLTATDKACSKLAAPMEGQILCHSPGEAGAQVDEMTQDRGGKFTVQQADTVLRTVEYDRVFTDGAAGHLYETYLTGQSPVLVLDNCGGDEGSYTACGVKLPPV